jgi:hypothetical protein
LNLPENREKNSILSNSSFSDVIKRVNMAFHSDDPKFFQLPENSATIRQYLEVLSSEDRNSDGRPDQIEQFVDKDYRSINLIIRTGSYKERTLSSANDKNIIRIVNEHLKNTTNPDHYKYFFVGTGINMLILSDYIVSGQLISIVSSIILIMFIIYFFFRKKAVSLISMIPLAGAIFIVYGIMGLLNIPLDIPRAILSSIAIGNGVDETIHFLRAVGSYVNQGRTFRQAIHQTYNEAGTAIIYTSTAVILGFSVLTLSSFTPIFSLGLLIAGVMFATSIGALLFLPAFLLLLNPDMIETKNDSDLK